MSPESDGYSQGEVANWFDETYRARGFGYLRPLAAYPIYLQLLGARPGQSLLDIACGLGHLLKAAQLRSLHPAGVDISEQAIEMAREYVSGAELHVANAEALPFDNGRFDYVTCTGAIERFLDREAALAEMQRVARKDARFCFLVRNSRTLAWTIWSRWLGRQNHEGHQDALTLEAWTELFEANGFRILAVHQDQWARQKLDRVLRLGRRHDFSKPEPVRRPILPLRLANEFTFILERAR